MDLRPYDGSPVHERPRGSSGRRRMITVFNSRLNVEHLGDIADSVRASLRARNGLGSKGEELMKVLGTAVKSEYDGVPIIDLETLKQARLDKLLADMVNKDYHQEDMPLKLRAHLSVAESLQRQWRMRFRGSYFSIDHTRYLYLTGIGGRLHNLIFNHASKDNSGLWKAKKCGSLSRLERNDRFKEGSWWLNLACACRDGMVSSAAESFSHNTYDIAVLSLLTGSETLASTTGQINYIREGDTKDMYPPLISQVGCRIRILRGHKLKSPFAPKAGIRYDGQYIIRQYGQKRDELSDAFRLSLVLQRVQGQLPIEELCRVPCPSEMDDWELYERFEGELVKQRCGNPRFVEWKMAKAQERIEKEQFERILQFECQTYTERGAEGE